MIVGGLPVAAWNAMHVDIDGPPRRRVQDEAAHARLLPCLAQGDRLGVALTRLRAAAGLQPAVQPAVADEEDARAAGRNDEGPTGDVPLRQRAIEGVGMRRDQGPDGFQASASRPLAAACRASASANAVDAF